MTVAEYLTSHYPFRFVHADHNERIHEKVRANPNNYEVIKVRFWYGRYYIEVREITKS